jgi:hypothetical protein
MIYSAKSTFIRSYLEKRNENKLISSNFKQILGNKHNDVVILRLKPVFS